jgi:hypothetical protein
MKIKITYLDASEEDCRRTDYVTYVNGKEYLLVACALGGKYTTIEVETAARKFFGDDVIINW